MTDTPAAYDPAADRNDYGLKDKVAFVTGATSGLGRQFSLALARAGCHVVVSGRRRERLDALVREVEALGVRAMALPLDVNNTQAVRDAVVQAERTLGPIWVLVNNSGVALTKRIVDITPEDYDWLMDTNLKAAFFMAQSVARHMIDGKRQGRIINIASIGAFKPLGQGSIYSMSKAAVVQMTKAMALEWARYGINVNAICPGYIRTEMNADWFDSEIGQRQMQAFPRRRIGRDTDLNGLLLLLASEGSQFITGSAMVADDGQLLA
ncbi:MAG: SDR family NAD(P)-dependent oxidoreductase [Alphaproteobacteria bacterium]|nr:MAG: SDR family NAD(P)-dependent oxidoreductase [Alphaproteobacteria bacterium]